LDSRKNSSAPYNDCNRIFLGHHIYPPAFPDIQSTIIYNTGPLRAKPDFPFKLDLKTDDKAWFKIFIVNRGNNSAEDLATQVTFHDNMIHNVEKAYTPPSLAKRIKDFSKANTSFYEMLFYLPARTTIEYPFHLNKLIKSSDEFKYYVVSKERDWTPSTSILPRTSRYLNVFQNTAYAEENINKEEHASAPGSGIFIGGYDPVVMSNELFDLLQAKKLITSADAVEIKKVTEAYKEGILFGGINVLKFNEVLINKLLQNKVISSEQATRIINRAP